MSTATLPAPSTPEDRLSDIFAALANSTRRAILARLATGEATVNELAEPFDISLPAISKHIKVLEEVGLISQTRKAQFRPCQLDTEPLQAVAGWAEQYRHIWDTSFDRMDAYVRQVQHDPDTATPDKPNREEPDNGEHSD
ncbi:MAG: metalloregulator ArsR/SmtB family transcription factor [Acidimicrobiia bacterium]|nr:metalloregulator ArsR/SmtB family transcription factor [Acidimicrobiia bacterium]